MNKGLRIAMVAAFPYPSGQGTQALVGELARGLSYCGHELQLVCYHHKAFDRPEPFSIRRILKVPFYHRLRSGPDLVKPILDLLVAVEAVRAIRHFDLQLVYAHNYEGAAAGWLAARLCGIPLIYHAHNLMEDELPHYFRRPVLTKFAGLAGVVLDYTIPRLAQRVIALHEPLACRLASCGVSAKRLTVIPPGIDTGFWDESRIPKDFSPTVVYTGNLDAYQDLPVLFSAMHKVIAKCSGARLLLATPNDIREGKRLAYKYNMGLFTEVIYTPEPQDARKALHRAHVAVSPRSSWSGFPIKNLNAQASGLPVVACKGSAFGIEHGKTGLVVPNHDTHAFAEALIRLLQDKKLAESYGAEAQRSVANKFGLDRLVDEVDKTMRKLVP